MLVKSQNLKATALTGVTVVLAVIACATIIANSAPEVLVLKMQLTLCRNLNLPLMKTQCQTELDDDSSEALPGGLKVVDVSAGDGPEPQIGEKIKVAHQQTIVRLQTVRNFSDFCAGPLHWQVEGWQGFRFRRYFV